MKKDLLKVSPLFIPMAIGSMAAGNIALKFKAKGTCESIVTACAPGTNSIGEAYRNIKTWIFRCMFCRRYRIFHYKN